MNKEAIVERLMSAARGLQVQRKDKDTMSDTGGVSKGREREPHQKPPRDDMKNRYRPKDKPAPEREHDTDKDKDTSVDTDTKSDKDTRMSSMTSKVAKDVVASMAEKEVERLLKDFLEGTSFANKVYAVGGYVRDEVLGLEAKDLDIVVEMRGGAEKVTKYIYQAFPDSVTHPRQMGASYPIWQITFVDNVAYDGEEYATGGAVIEFADTQKESFPDTESRQRVTEYGTLAEDVERRDFTVNMLMKDLTTGELKDLTGTSVRDIQTGLLRGHPGVDFNKILSDDPLRMIRLVRFQVKYGWAVPLSVLKTVKNNAQRIQIVSGERIRDELIKIMQIGKLGKAVKFMSVIGLLKYVMPEIEGMKGVEQGKTHHAEGDVFRHTLSVLQHTKPGVENQLAALLHDVGKPAVQEMIGDRIQFHGHEKVGGDIAEALMRRMKFDNSTVSAVRVMVENHMKPHYLGREDSGASGLRRFIRNVGDELVEAVLDLAEADSLGSIPSVNDIPDLRKRIDEVRAPVQQAEKPPLDGNEIQALLGIKPGKTVGEAIQFLKDTKYQWLIDGREMTKADAQKLILDKFGGVAKNACDKNVIISSVNRKAYGNAGMAKAVLSKFPQTFEALLRKSG